jgi:hypothetical protein
MTCMGEGIEMTARLTFTLNPRDYGRVLRMAFNVIQTAHPIIVSAIENGDVKFPDIETYLADLHVLKNGCGGEDFADFQVDVFLDEAVDDWSYEEPE